MPGLHTGAIFSAPVILRKIMKGAVPMFTPRALIPAKGNPYYNRKSDGGYSPCIAGKPRQSGLTVLANCVGYATGRFNEIINSGSCLYLGNTNAENFIVLAESQGLAVKREPSFGGCMVWAKGKPGNSADGAGHVAIVEGINPDGSIVTSESEWSHRPFVTRVRSGSNWSQGSGYTYLGCIVNPGSANPYTRPDYTIRQSDNSAGVKWLQYYLQAHGFDLGVWGIDGSFGSCTLKALKRFQARFGLLPDGVCGRLTKNALERGFAV